MRSIKQKKTQKEDVFGEGRSKNCYNDDDEEKCLWYNYITRTVHYYDNDYYCL